MRGDVVRVADVADLRGTGAEAAGGIVLGNPPWPGRLREISRVLVKARMVSEGVQLDELAFSGSPVCVVELETTAVSPERLVDRARTHLESLFPEDGPKPRIELTREPSPVLIAADEGDLELVPSVSGSGPPADRTRVDVDIVRNGVRLKRVTLNFNVRVYADVPVATRKIGVGDRLGPGNVTTARRDVTSVRGGCPRSTQDVFGRIATQPVQAGQVITRRLIEEPEPPVVIEPGQRVFLVVETPGLRISTYGKSLCRARRGEIARAANLTTGREVVGVAGDGGIISVFLGGMTDER